ncbi:hypothetical protein J5N97_029013 [Dioscorea zingiberensis]|uniref:C3H1-type domain-containing protein n=1 Tax=Dioscorea zingiberensis TaxID=325984 RepID=A0A9D5BZI2_9LILI|nr:hypothetical protein J5N97_029013 [Dioscorea zingiberensis]
METGGGREAIRPPTAEEEALKRSTDCVYFLASPLTCKKGSECEYRHSENARLNPCDCYYWLNGSCLNPKCSYRHPPLEGLTVTPSGSAPIPTQTMALTQSTPAHGPTYNSSKQSAPCYYFQQGFCLKGNRCPFMHGPPLTGNPALQQVSKVSSPSNVEPSPMLKKDSWVFKECNTQQKIFKDPAVKVPPASAKSAARTEIELKKGPNNLSALHLHNEFRRSQPLHASIGSGNAESRLLNHQVQPVDVHPHNGREADEFLAESSPGFDVLVDDDVEDVGYFPNEEEFGRGSAQGGKSLNAVNGFDYRHSDYEAVPRYERDQYNGMSEFDRQAQSYQRHGPEQHRDSTKRVADMPLLHERKVREKNLDQIDGSDLRHQLLKRKRLNGSRAAVSPDRRVGPYRRDGRHAEERYHDRTEERYHVECRDQSRFPTESSISTRLKGRITLPRRTSPGTLTDHRSEREIDRARHRGRSSPPRPINYQGRRHLHDRIRQRPDEDFAADVRNSGGQAINKDDSDSLNFAGPKSLAELKIAKALKSSQDQPVNSSNVTVHAVEKTVLGSVIISEESDGSNPPSIVLEEKCDAAQGNCVISINGQNGIKRDGHVVEGISDSAVNKEYKPVPITVEEKVLIPVEGTKVDHLKMEEGAVVQNMDEDHDLENVEQRDGDYEYEEVEGAGLKAEDDDDMYQEDEEEVDDEDDFARKVGNMFS